MRHIIVFFVAVFLASTVVAQVSINLGINLDRQPIWGPTGYDHVEYYYLPDIGVYYNVPHRMFYYSEGGRWIGRSSLPSRYRDFDLYRSHKVVVNEREPYRNDEKYRGQYSSFKGRQDQEPIRDSHDAKYFVNANHPEHANWVRQQRQGNGKRNGNGNGNGNGRGNGRGNKPGRK